MKAQTKFVSNRTFTHTSVMGHSIAFEKGVPIGVPRELHKEVTAAGVVPADDDTVIDMGDGVKEKPEMSEDERDEMLRMVLLDMKARNDSDEFTANGTPKVKVVAAAAGFDVSAAEVSALWAEMNQAGE